MALTLLHAVAMMWLVVGELTLVAMAADAPIGDLVKDRRISRFADGGVYVAGTVGVSPAQAFQALEAQAGRWRVENGMLVQTDPAASHARTFIKERRWMDCIIKAKVRVDTVAGPADSPGVRLIVRSDEKTDTFYTVGLWAGNREVRIEKARGLVFETMKTDHFGTLAIAPFPVELGKTYELTVAVDHATIYCYIDGKFAVLAQEPDFSTQPTGRIGFFTHAATGAFSDVSVQGRKGVAASPLVPYAGSPLNTKNYAPAVVKDDRYRLWDGYNELPNGAGRYTESQDGIIWTRPVGMDPVVIRGHPGDWPIGNACGDPDVLKLNGEYWITYWSTSNRRNGAFDGMGIQRSSDGIHWTPEPANPVFYMGPLGDWDEMVVGDHALIKDGDRFKMWHVGITYGWRGFRNEFGYAESFDGIHWRKCRLNPVLTQGRPGTWDGGWIYAAGIVKIDDEPLATHVYAGKPGASYHLFYTGQPSNNEIICGVKRIGYAFSLDGIHWVKWNDPNTAEPFHDSDPVVTWPEYGQIGCLGVGAATAILVGDEVRLYYSMYDDRKETAPLRPEGAVGTGLATVKADTLRAIVAKAKAQGLLQCSDRQEIDAVLDDPLPQSMWDDLQGYALTAIQAKACSDANREKSALAAIAATRAKFTKALERYYAHEFAPLQKVVDHLQAGRPVTEKVLWTLPEKYQGSSSLQLEIPNLNIAVNGDFLMIEIEADCNRFQFAQVAWATDKGFQPGEARDFIIGYPQATSPTYRVIMTSCGQPIRALRLQFPGGAAVNLKQVRIRELRMGR